jgi:hypothetical protein
MASDEYYALINGKESGPTTSGNLRRLAREGQLIGEDKVRKGKSGNWVEARNVKGLFPEPKAEPTTTEKKPPLVGEIVTAPARLDEAWPPVHAIVIHPPTAVAVPSGQQSLDLIQSPIAGERAMVACPFCAEMILAAAKKCKHCGETLDVAMRAAEEAQRAAQRAPTAAAAVSVVNQHSVVFAAPKHGFPHGLHLLATLLTLGWWLPVWILHYLFRSRSYYY